MDVLAVMDDSAEIQGAVSPEHLALQARAAVAELIEADKELQFIRQNGCAAETYEAAIKRHDAALARVQGGA